MPTISQNEADWFADVFDRMVANIEKAVIGRTDIVKATVTCLFAQGHLLLEDVSGSGKTTLARSLARCVHGTQSRIQFTPDLSPTDITGESVYDERLDRFRLHAGPIFSNIVVADELNRSPPRTQSALLEVMEEGRVTIRGVTNLIGPPFMVVATQNPLEVVGTFPLPEAQLDRFLMRLNVGHPDDESTFILMSDSATRDRSTMIEPILQAPTLARGCEIANSVYVDPQLVRYGIRILNASRDTPGVRTGVSVRGGLNYMRAAKAWAASHGRTHVIPDDLKDLAHPVLGHRITITPEAAAAGLTSHAVVDEVIHKVPEPVA